MDQDLNDVYRQTVKISTLFAAGCEDRANFYLATMAMQAAYPTVCEFLLEDIPNATNRAYVLEQLLTSLNGHATIKSDWIEYNQRMLRGFLQSSAPQIERKMSNKHVENMAALWRFGQNIQIKENTLYHIASSVGISEEGLKQLNKKLIDQSTSAHYTNFFKEVIGKWCVRATAMHKQTHQVFEDVNQKIATTSKVKL